MTQRPRTLAKDDLFHILQNSRRRAVLRYLLAHPKREQFVMRTVTEAVAAWEHGTPINQLSYQPRQRVYIALYQCHLPKLDQHGLIDYDRERGFIEPTRLIHVVAPYLEDGLHAETVELTAPDELPSEQPLSAGASPRLDR